MSDAYRLLRGYPGTTAIYFTNPSFDVDWAAPADVTSALGHDLESEEESVQALRSALTSGAAAMTKFMELSISGRGFKIFVPAYRGGDFAGVIAGVYRAQPFFEAVLENNHPGFSVALYQEGKLIYALREGTSRLAAVDQSFAVNDQVWSVRIAPTSEMVSELRSRLPEAVLVAGFILATLLALSIYFYQTAEARREEIEAAHEELQREVAERRLAEQQLEVSRDFYLRLFSEFPNLVWRCDASGKCDYFNQAWLDYTGRTLEQELGDGWADGVHPDDIEFCLAAYDEALAARRPFATEYRLRRADGSYGWIYDVGRPYYDIKGTFRGYLGTCYDIDERRRMETALKESASRFRAMAANVPGAMLQLLHRSEGDYVFPYLSKGIANLCGVEAEAVAANAETLFSLMAHEDRQQLTDTLETSAHTLSRFSWNGRIVLADESERWVNLRASPSRLPGGAIMWDGFLFDETEERVAQIEIERSRAQLQALSMHLQTVREEEKANVARELHDELGGKLAALKMGAVWLSGKLTPDQGALLAKTHDLARLADEAVAGVRRMITALRPTVLDDLGLVAAMQWQATEFRRRFAIECRLTVDAEDTAVDEGTALELFRIFQETLNNVARHAQATRVLASFEEVDHAYVLRV
ncbi:MAG TPA: PAS domain-containing protein, partial [Burkholderiales bacterium]|nr:PAS domain-containing protein [Burkholderiales bacterium]